MTSAPTGGSGQLMAIKGSSKALQGKPVSRFYSFFTALRIGRLLDSQFRGYLVLREIFEWLDDSTAAAACAAKMAARLVQWRKKQLDICVPQW
jgi:hypothetical protein